MLRLSPLEILVLPTPRLPRTLHDDGHGSQVNLTATSATAGRKRQRGVKSAAEERLRSIRVARSVGKATNGTDANGPCRDLHNATSRISAEQWACSTILVEAFCHPVGMFRSPSDPTSSSGGGSPLAKSSHVGGLNPTLCSLSKHIRTAWKVGVARTFNSWIIIVATVGWRFQIIGRESAKLE